MSKIQDALHKLQAGRGNHNDAPQMRISKKPQRNSEPDAARVSEIVIELDEGTLRDVGLLAALESESSLANQFRDMKRPLIANALGKRVTKVEDGNLIMVTSSLAGEGKTFTVMNLAMSMAREQDVSVLLVDGDVAKPHITEVFGVEGQPGLLDLLESENGSPESMIIPTSSERLSILPAGRPRSHAAELLFGSRMESILRDLTDRDDHRMILFDTPPILQSSESKVLLGFAGQVVLIIKAESTTQGVVASALQELGSERAVNLVLNQVRGSSIGYDFGHGYGYGAQEKPPSEQSQESVFRA